MKLRMGAAIALAFTGILVSAAGAIASVEADVPYQCVWPAGPTSTHTVPVTLEVPTAAVVTGEPFTASWGWERRWPRAR